MGFGLILLIIQTSLCVVKNFDLIGEEHVNVVLGGIVLIGIGWYFMEKRINENNQRYSTVPL